MSGSFAHPPAVPYLFARSMGAVQDHRGDV
jgi:hypothetical protein